MLSSRYLHLHEALDLGPMWLKRGAKLVAADAENKGQTAVQTASVPQTAATERPSENTAPAAFRRPAIMP